jgi:hypothetical protein
MVIRCALDSKIDEKYALFDIFENYRVELMGLKKDYKLTVVDKLTNTHGFLVCTHKKIIKEAVYRAMEDSRFLCRARNVDHLYAFATNLYEW